MSARRTIAALTIALASASLAEAQAGGSKPKPTPAPKPSTRPAPADTMRTTPATETMSSEAGGETSLGTAIGLFGGFNLATFGGEGVDGVSRFLTSTGGLYLVRPLGASLSIRPEVLFSPKGAKEEDQGVTGTYRLNYIDIPLLLQFEPRRTAGLRPMLHAGPTLGLNIGCSIRVQQSGQNGQNFKCSEADLEPSTIDFSAIVGGGVSFPVNGRRVTVGGRYQHSFSEVAADAQVSNRVISFFTSVEFGR
jgi:hypothetical protein